MPEKAKIPVYTNDYQYAQENRDYDEWRASNNANKECSAALDKAINENYTYENYHLDTNAVINSVYEGFGKERTDYILAAHIVNHDWDGRFSNGVKEWAKDKFKYLDQNYVRSELREHGLKSHSTLIDGVARTVILREKELENSTASKVKVDFHPHRPDEFILKEIATGCTVTTGTREEVRRFCEAELAVSVKITELEVLIDNAEKARQDHIAEMKAREIAMEAEFLASEGCMAAIYQIKNLPENRDILFMDTEFLEEQGLKPDRDRYSLVYSFEVLPEDLNDKNRFLNNVFAKFNLDHPKDFTGHSLSVSDVVVIKNHGEITSHFVDSFDFTEIKDFVKERENPLKAVEDAVEQNDNKFDGIINNTPAETEKENADEDRRSEKKSILSYLKEANPDAVKSEKQEKEQVKTKSKGVEI